MKPSEMSEAERDAWLQRAMARASELQYRPDPNPACCDDPACPHRKYNLSQIATLDAFVKLHTALRDQRDSAQTLWPDSGPDACTDPTCQFEEDMHTAITKAITAARAAWQWYAQSCALTNVDLGPEIAQLVALIPAKERNPATTAWLRYEQWPDSNQPPSNR